MIRIILSTLFLLTTQFSHANPINPIGKIKIDNNCSVRQGTPQHDGKRFKVRKSNMSPSKCRVLGIVDNNNQKIPLTQDNLTSKVYFSPYGSSATAKVVKKVDSKFCKYVVASMGNIQKIATLRFKSGSSAKVNCSGEHWTSSQGAWRAATDMGCGCKVE